MKRLLLMTALLAVLMPVPAMAQAESAKALQGTKLRPDINVHAVVGNQRLDTPIELGAAPFSSVQVAGEVPQNLSYIVVVNATDNKGNPVDDIKINRIKLRYNKIVGSPEFPYMGTPVVQNFIIRYKPDGKPEVIDEDTGFPVARAVFVLWRTARFFDRLQTIGCLSWDFWVGYPLCIPDPWPFKNGEPTLPTRVSESRLYPLIGEVPFGVDEKSNNPWGRSQAIEIIISTDWLAEAEFEVEFDAVKKMKNGTTRTELELAAGTFVMDLDDDGASNRYELNEGTDMRDPASYPGGPMQVTVPNVANFPIGNAITKLESKGLEAVVSGYRNDPNVPKDAVISHSPSAGAVVSTGSNVALLISLGSGSGPNKVIVPSVDGMTEQIARNTLASYRLGTGLVNEVHNSAAAGTVIGQSPSAGALVDEFSLVNLTVSLGLEEEPCMFPNVMGLSDSVAQEDITEAGFSLAGRVVDYFSTGPAWDAAGFWRVYGQDDPGSYACGSAPYFVVKGGVRVPCDLAGCTVSFAVQEIEKVGVLGVYLNAEVLDEAVYHPTIPSGNVVSYTKACQDVAAGSTIYITKSKGPQTPDPLCMVYTAPANGAHIPSGTLTRFSWSITGGTPPFTVRFLPPNGNAFMEFTTISRTPYADVLLVSSAQPGPSTESGYSQVTDGGGTLFPPAGEDRLTITLTID